jgi:hypothetical protein
MLILVRPLWAQQIQQQDGIDGATASTVQAIPLNDDVVIDTGEVVTLSIQADVESTALAE